MRKRNTFRGEICRLVAEENARSRSERPRNAARESSTAVGQPKKALGLPAEGFESRLSNSRDLAALQTVANHRNQAERSQHES